MLRVSSTVFVPDDELHFTFARAAGPGGQNVNKVNSKAILSWPIDAARGVPEGVKQRVRRSSASRINRQGVLIISSQRFRDQPRNVADCLEKLRAILARAEHPPKPRIATRRTKSSKRRRLETKQRTSLRKRLRRAPGSGD